MTPTKQERYRALVEKRKAYNPERFGLANPSAPEFRKYDSDEIGPWTRWANDLDADLMVVGQDWGTTDISWRTRDWTKQVTQPMHSTRVTRIRWKTGPTAILW